MDNGRQMAAAKFGKTKQQGTNFVAHASNKDVAVAQQANCTFACA